ncbi:hypothetical protein EG329_003347 [Mollisiaceae sp. DMI_Dod_QoI]|nr:hypothetical protein EG329_003347 [Helotiales sp. DMI_Dod_QoI]
MGEMKIDLPHIVVLTCADPRADPRYFLDLKPTDGILYFHNVNGHVAAIIDDILALDSFIGITDIMVVHHTDCGATHFTDDMIRTSLKNRLPNHEEIDKMAFGAVSDLEQSIRDDLAILKASPLMRKELLDRSVGFIYDIKTGKLNPVEE